MERKLLYHIKPTGIDFASCIFQVSSSQTELPFTDNFLLSLKLPLEMFLARITYIYRSHMNTYE